MRLLSRATLRGTRVFQWAKRRKADSRVDAIAIYLPSGPARILDYGCGNMSFDKALAHRFPSLEITGLDVRAYEGLDLSEHPRLRFQAYEGGPIPFDDTSFDAVVATAAIHHAESPCASLGDMARVTRSGGRLIVVDDAYRTPLRHAALHLNHAARELMTGMEPGRPRFLSDDAWQRLFESLSLRVVARRQVRPFSYLLTKTIFVLER